MIIAIDGYSSSGKSTIAKMIAKALSYTYIDTGAMYRAATLHAIRHRAINFSKNNIDIDELHNCLDKIDIKFNHNPDSNKQETYLNDENVEKEIRDMLVSNWVSHIAKIRFVRKKMVAIQKEMGKNKKIVMDGRDIGTVVFPEADLKFFITAKVETRALRRYQELREKGVDVSLDAIKKNVQERDHLDETREESPLKKAVDAIVLDNSKMSIEEQFEWVMKKIKEETENESRN